MVEGQTFLGVDFGTSNSYLTSFFQPEAEAPQTTTYLDLRFKNRTRSTMRELQTGRRSGGTSPGDS